jgi:hypothetical protein
MWGSSCLIVIGELVVGHNNDSMRDVHTTAFTQIMLMLPLSS